MKANDVRRLKELERDNATFGVISNVLLFGIGETGFEPATARPPGTRTGGRWVRLASNEAR
jgi:hypothetical protein